MFRSNGELHPMSGRRRCSANVHVLDQDLAIVQAKDEPAAIGGEECMGWMLV